MSDQVLVKNNSWDRTTAFWRLPHYYDPSRSLLWEFGEVTCPPVQQAPPRLMLLLPYQACN